MRLIYKSSNDSELDYMVDLIQKQIAVFSDKRITNEFIMNKIKKNRNYLISSLESTNKKRKTSKRLGIVSFLIQKRALYLDYIALEEEAQHRGFGRAIMERLEQEAKKHRLQFIHLDVLRKNQPAIHAYEKYGFVRTKSRRNHYRMEKRITTEMTDEREN